MKVAELVGRVLLIADVEMKDQLAIGRIEERDIIAPPFADRFGRAFGVSLGLFKNVLSAKSKFLGFDNAGRLFPPAKSA